MISSIKFLLLSVLLYLFIETLNSLPACFSELSDISVLPSDPDFPALSFVDNPLYAKIPAFISLPLNISDIQRCLQCAKRHNLRAAIKSGGHSSASYSSIASPDFMINMLHMKNVTWVEDTIEFSSINSNSNLSRSLSAFYENDTKVVKVQSGARWHNVYQFLWEHGGLWVITGGLCPSVGVAGFTMGGGIGAFGRKFGLAVDNVVGFTLVTEDGSQVLKVDENENADLFWGLRGGGGGNFGVVADISFKVNEVSPWQSWGTICYNYSEKTTIKQALTNLAKLERELPWTINVDVVLEKENGLCFWVIYHGAKEEALSILSPILNDPQVRPYNVSFLSYDSWWEMIKAFAKAHGYPTDDQSVNPPFKTKNGFVFNVSEDFASLLSGFNFPDFCNLHMIHFAGVIDTVKPTETAFYWRGARYMVYIDCGFENEEERNISEEFLGEWWEALSPFFEGSYLNFIDRDLENWKERYYGGNFNRLLEVKKKWNPVENGGPLHFDQEINA